MREGFVCVRIIHEDGVAVRLGDMSLPSVTVGCFHDLFQF